MAITIYSPDCTDFSTNGLGTLTPISCTAYAEDGHFTELELAQPIDGTNRWAQLQRDMILKAPVPARESPLYEAVEDITEGEDVTVTREIWRVRVRTRLRLRSGPGTNYAILDAYRNGTQVVRLETSGNWMRVTVVNGGRTGWMSMTYLTYDHSTTEVISRVRVVGQRVVEYRQSSDQLWRIYSVEPDTARGVVVAKAQHIFYDLQYNLVGEDYKPENVPARTALTEIWNKLSYPPAHALHIASGEELDAKIETGDYGFKNPIECMLEKDDGVLSVMNARLVLDNYDVFVLPNLTRDNGMTIRRRKNLKGVRVTDDGSGIVTRVIPCGKTKDGDPLFIVDGTGPKQDGVDSAHIGDYPAPRVKKIDYDVKIVDKDPDNEKTFTDINQARAKLKELAQEEYDKNGIDLSQYGMKVDFILAENSADYSEYAGLQTVFLGDTVTVIDELIGLRAKVEAVGFKFDCLTRRYESLTLGEIDELTQKVYSYQLPTGGISGAKIAAGSADGSIMRDLSVQYAKISTAAIERLSADAITALTAYIGNLTAQTITTDTLVASVAHMLQLTADNIDAERISTDVLATQLAHIAVLAAGTATFDQATVKNLVAQAMNLDFGTGGDVFINNLRVAYAQMVSAAIGNLCIQASDGGYYLIDVNADGTVTATQTTVTDREAAAGQTDGGQVILGTDITAETLSTGSLLATYALVNQIDAARIDVDQLFAREAFTQRLDTAWITSDAALTIVTRLNDLDQASADAQTTADDIARRLRMWFKFDSDEGLVIQKMDEDGNPVSIWSTVTDEVGYHIRRSDLRDYVFSAYRDRVRVQKLEIGKITVKASSKGGWVWTKSADQATETQTAVETAAQTLQAIRRAPLRTGATLRR